MVKQAVDLDALGADYRAAVAAVGAHRKTQVDLELVWARTQDPADLAAAQKAEADVNWCKALVIACGEKFKGESFDTVVARNITNGRPEVNR